MLEHFEKHFFSSFPLDFKTPILIGYSGGADSTCLLHLMKQTGLKIIAAHLHHGLRVEATEEQTCSQQFCKEQGIPFFTENVNVTEIAKKHKIGLEEAGRKARYHFFQKLAAAKSCSFIATAHTMDDQAETILFNLARGTGLAGLSGIPEKNKQLIRPLLIFKRSETIGYCKEHGLWFHEDPSNKDPRFSRSRIRHFVLPHLLEINTNLQNNILHCSKIVSEENAFLNQEARKVLECSFLNRNGVLSFLTKNQEWICQREDLIAFPKVLLKRALRLIAADLHGNLDYHQTNFILEQLEQAVKGSLTTEGGKVIFQWDAKHLYAYKKREFPGFQFPVKIPQQISYQQGNWCMSLTPKEMDTEKNWNQKSLKVWMDPQPTKGSLLIRTYHPGDQLQPMGFHSSRKLKDLFSEAHLSQQLRYLLPVLCDEEGPIWVPGINLSERVKPFSKTKECVELHFESL